MAETWSACADGSILTTPGVERAVLERYRVVELRLPRDADRVEIARFIVRACNSYDDLLTACKAALELLDESGQLSYGYRVLYFQESNLEPLRAAIAKAEGGTDA